MSRYFLCHDRGDAGIRGVIWSASYAASILRSIRKGAAVSMTSIRMLAVGTGPSREAAGRRAVPNPRREVAHPLLSGGSARSTNWATCDLRYFGRVWRRGLGPPTMLLLGGALQGAGCKVRRKAHLSPVGKGYGGLGTSV